MKIVGAVKSPESRSVDSIPEGQVFSCTFKELHGEDVWLKAAHTFTTLNDNRCVRLKDGFLFSGAIFADNYVPLDATLTISTQEVPA